MDKATDQDRGKGATEQDEHNRGGNMNTGGQLGHRDRDPDLKDADTDFPEPDANGEHSGAETT
jgi:hypothetical protein